MVWLSQTDKGDDYFFLCKDGKTTDNAYVLYDQRKKDHPFELEFTEEMWSDEEIVLPIEFIR